MFGYTSSSPERVQIPIGSQNYVAGETQDRGQPRWFDPGATPMAFTVHSSGAPVAWHLGAEIARLTSTSEAVCSENPAESTGPRIVATAEGRALEVDGERYLLAPEVGAVAEGKIVPTTGGLEPIAGDVDVTADGAATYRVPLWLPPGRAGMQPSVSLSYHSRGGNGLLGVGWSLSAGASQITRCHRNLRNSTTVRSIRFDRDDLFCLDGNPLVPAGGTYGATGEYRTQKASFAKIESEGDAATTEAGSQMGPATFKVSHKGGRIYTYQRAFDLGFVTRRQGVDANYTWLLSKVEDRFGNNLLYFYQFSTFTAQDNNTIDARLAHIRYTGYGGAEGSRAVSFLYVDRPDPIERYVGGLRIYESKRLKTITMRGPNPAAPAPLRTYTLSYADEPGVGGGSISGRSLLRQVTECDVNQVCRPTSTFTWEPGDLTYEEQPDIDLPDVQTGFLVDDVDFDGRDDIVYTTGSQGIDSRGIDLSDVTSQLGWYRRVEGSPTPGQGYRPEDQRFPAFQQISPLISASPYDWIAQRYVDPVLFDVNQDGYREVGAWADSRYRFSDLQTGAPIGDSGDIDVADKSLFQVDVTGDGIPETFGRTPAGIWRYRKGTLTGSMMAAPWEDYLGADFGYDPSGREAFSPIDVDGDGVSEILLSNKKIVRAPGLRDPARPIEDVPGLGEPWAWVTIKQIDLNGDGLSDIIEIPQSRPPDVEEGPPSPPYSRHGLYVKINQGGSFVRSLTHEEQLGPLYTFTNSYRDWGVRVTDLDHDGRPDVAYLGALDSAPSGGTISASRHGLTSHMSLMLAGGQAIPRGSVIWGGYPGSRLVDVDSDGLQDIVQLEGPQGARQLKYYRRRGQVPDVITSFSNGVQLSTNVLYDDLAGYYGVGYQDNPPQSPYRAGQIACNVAPGMPQKCVKKGFRVAVRVSRDTGLVLPARRELWYKYEGGVRDTFVGGTGVVFREHRRQRWDGASEHTTYHVGAVSDPFYAQMGFLLAGKPDTSVVSLELTRTTTRYGYDTRSFVHGGTGPVEGRGFAVLGAGTEVLFVDGLLAPGRSSHRKVLTTVLYHPDEYGNEHRRTIEEFEDDDVLLARREVVTGYSNTLSSWLVGIPNDVTTSIDRLPGATKISRVRTARIDPATGAIDSETTTVPGAGADFTLTTTYDLTPYGLPERVTTTGHAGDGVQDRVVQTVYDSVDHAFPVRVINPGDHVVETLFHPGYGVPLWSRDGNGAVSTTTYETFGRVRETSLPNGQGVVITYGAATGAFGVRSVRTAAKNGGTTHVDLDRLGRERQTSTFNSRGLWTTVSRSYDVRGRLATVSTPIEEASPGAGQLLANPHNDPRPVGQTVYTYDGRNRLTLTTNPDGTSVSVDIVRGLRITTDARTHKTYELLDSRDRVVETGLGDFSNRREARLTITYATEGQVHTVTDARGNVTTSTYDDLGRRSTFKDPNSALRTTLYNAFGEVRREEVTGESVATVFIRDRLGRVKTKTDSDGTTTFAWDTARNGVGALDRSQSPTGVRTVYSYDDLGRPESEATFIEGEWLRTSRGYDPATGRVERVTYPSVPRPGQTDVPTVVRYAYDPGGTLGRIFNDDDTLTYFEVTKRDELDRPLEERAGDLSFTTRKYDWFKGRVSEIALLSAEDGTRFDVVEYDYDDNLNVQRRIDLTNPAAPRAEVMVYDEQDRLTGWYEPNAQGGGSRWSVSYDIDVLGNLRSRTLRVGGSVAQSLDHTYPTTESEMPHAPRATTGGGETIDGDYHYEVRGTQSTRPLQGVTYTAFDLPATVTEPLSVVSYRYDAGGARVWKAERLGQPGETWTKYVGGVYEKRRLSDGSFDHVFYVRAGSRVVTQITRTSADPVATYAQYLHDDRLGSITTVTTPGGVNGAQLAGRTAFDPHGNQYTGTDYPLVLASMTEVAPGVRMGFTGHEMDSDLSLINMRGRMYDPKVGRFLSPDPIVANATFDQSYNRYAYVLNNPFRYVDPTGYCGQTITNQRGDQVWEEGDCPARSSYDEGFLDQYLNQMETDAETAAAEFFAQRAAEREAQRALEGNGAGGHSIAVATAHSQGAAPPRPQRGPLSASEKADLDRIIAPAVRALAAYDSNPSDKRLRALASEAGQKAVLDTAKAIGLPARYSARLVFDIDERGYGRTDLQNKRAIIGTNGFVLGLGVAANIVHESMHVWQAWGPEKMKNTDIYNSDPARYENQASDLTYRYLRDLGFSPSELEGIPNHRVR